MHVSMCKLGPAAFAHTIANCLYFKIWQQNEVRYDLHVLYVTGVKPYVNPTGVDVMMPLPPASLFSRGPLTQKQQPCRMKLSTSFANKMFEPPLAIYGVQTGSTCCECEGDFLGEDHFP